METHVSQFCFHFDSTTSNSFSNTSRILEKLEFIHKKMIVLIDENVVLMFQ